MFPADWVWAALQVGLLVAVYHWGKANGYRDGYRHGVRSKWPGAQR